jgi:hypothetical protein
LAGFFIGGPIGAALGLSGAVATTVSGAATGAIAGGLIGALMKLGLDRDTAESYDRTVNAGGIVIGVTETGLEGGRAQMILEKHGADNISLLEIRETEEARNEHFMPRQQPVFGEAREGTKVEDDLDR